MFYTYLEAPTLYLNEIKLIKSKSLVYNIRVIEMLKTPSHLK